MKLLREQLRQWHWNRVVHNATPIFWILAFIWGRPGFHWLWQLRCRHVEWLAQRHNQRMKAKLPDLYTWSRT